LGLTRRLTALIAAAALALPAAAVFADPAPARAPYPATLRIASFDAELSRKGPGLLLRDITQGKDAQVLAAAMVLAQVDADVVLLTGFDWDHDLAALRAFAQLLGRSGVEYPHLFAARSNRGVPSGVDLDGDGRLSQAEDAQGWGRFTGQNALALLSRVPLGEVVDYSAELWRDQPGNLIGDSLAPQAAAVQLLSTTGHWDVTLLTEPPLHLLAFSATPPVFDGPEDRNGRRNHDEVAFWSRHLPDAPFVLAGNANLDPLDGDGRHQAIRALLADPRLQDPQPRSAGGVQAADPDHKGDPGLDTVDWPDGDPGNLRVTYLLPSQGLQVQGSGVVWPRPGAPLSKAVLAASPHRLVWLDLLLPDAAPR